MGYTEIMNISLYLHSNGLFWHSETGGLSFCNKAFTRLFPNLKGDRCNLFFSSEERRGYQAIPIVFSKHYSTEYPLRVFIKNEWVCLLYPKNVIPFLTKLLPHNGSSDSNVWRNGFLDVIWVRAIDRT